MTMQTDDYLEELTDRPIEVDSETQTHPLLNRPPSPLFVPAKIGYDKATQIADGDLFDFDLEVEPLLEVLVGKSIQMAMMELMEEEELEAIRAQQAKFEEQRNAELAEVQRLEAEARRKHVEKENRLQQEQARKAARQQLEEKIAARGFAKQYLLEMHSRVFDNLHEAGYFYDPVRKEVEDMYMPDMLGKVDSIAANIQTARTMADELIRQMLRVAKTHFPSKQS